LRLTWLAEANRFRHMVLPTDEPVIRDHFRRGSQDQA
jgi:hypothetical protein